MQQPKHNPLTFYLRTLLYTFIALLLRLVAIAPLAALAAFPAGSPLRYAALLCPILVIFGILPLRYSFADALVQPSRCRYFSYDKALGFSRYWDKLTEGLLHALSVLKWGIPLLVMGAYAWYVKDTVDAKTLMVTVSAIGRDAGNFWYGIVNFFVTLFGQPAIKPVAASLVQGIYVLLGVVGLGVLVLLYGALRNSASRYIWAVASRADRPVRTEIRRRLRGRRWRQLLVGLCNLVLWSPFVVVVALNLKDVMGQAFTQMMMMVGYNGGSGLNVAEALLPLLLAFVLLYMPLLPARRIITAAFAAHDVRHAAPRQTAQAKPAAPVQPEEQQPMPAAIVPDWVREQNEAPDASVVFTPAAGGSYEDGASAENSSADNGGAGFNV